MRISPNVNHTPDLDQFFHITPSEINLNKISYVSYPGEELVDNQPVTTDQLADAL